MEPIVAQKERQMLPNKQRLEGVKYFKRCGRAARVLHSSSCHVLVKHQNKVHAFGFDDK